MIGARPFGAIHAALVVLSTALMLTTDARAQGASQANDPRREPTVNEARGLVLCKTIMTFSESHGTQVEYFGPNGTNYLWYPGNAVIVPGRWSAVAILDHTKFCFLYGPYTYNPVTHETGGHWSCQSARDLADRMVDSIDGDIFGLATRGAAPFKLSRERTSIMELRKSLTVRSDEKQSRQASDPECKAVVSEIWLHSRLALETR